MKPNRLSHAWSRIAIAVFGGTLALGALFGCSAAPHVAYVPMTGDATADPPTTDVEVLLDRAPPRAHVVTGQFFAKAFTNPQSIELMRRKAAAAGLDGIYWIDCTSTCSGRCTAKGYVYVDRALARAASSRRIAAE